MPDGIARKSSSAAKALLGAELRIGVGQLTQWYRDNGTKSEVQIHVENYRRSMEGLVRFQQRAWEPSSSLTLRSCWHINRLAVLRQVATGESEKAYVQHDVGDYDSVQVEEMLPQRRIIRL